VEVGLCPQAPQIIINPLLPRKKARGSPVCLKRRRRSRVVVGIELSIYYI